MRDRSSGKKDHALSSNNSAAMEESTVSSRSSYSAGDGSSSYSRMQRGATRMISQLTFDIAEVSDEDNSRHDDVHPMKHLEGVPISLDDVLVEGSSRPNTKLDSAPVVRRRQDSLGEFPSSEKEDSQEEQEKDEETTVDPAAPFTYAMMGYGDGAPSHDHDDVSTLTGGTRWVPRRRRSLDDVLVGDEVHDFDSPPTGMQRQVSLKSLRDKILNEALNDALGRPEDDKRQPPKRRRSLDDVLMGDQIYGLDSSPQGCLRKMTSRRLSRNEESFKLPGETPYNMDDLLKEGSNNSLDVELSAPERQTSEPGFCLPGEEVDGKEYDNSDHGADASTGSMDDGIFEDIHDDAPVPSRRKLSDDNFQEDNKDIETAAFGGLQREMRMDLTAEKQPSTTKNTKQSTMDDLLMEGSNHSLDVEISAPERLSSQPEFHLPGEEEAYGEYDSDHGEASTGSMDDGIFEHIHDDAPVPLRRKTSNDNFQRSDHMEEAVFGVLKIQSRAKFERRPSLDDALLADGVHDTLPLSPTKRRTSFDYIAEKQNETTREVTSKKSKFQRRPSLDDALFADGLHDSSPRSPTKRQASGNQGALKSSVLPSKTEVSASPARRHKFERRPSLDDVLFSEGVHDTDPPSTKRKNSLVHTELVQADFEKPKLKRTSSLDEVLFSEGIYDTGPPSQIRRKNSLGFKEQDDFEKPKLKRASSLDELSFSEGIHGTGPPSQITRKSMSPGLTTMFKSLELMDASMKGSGSTGNNLGEFEKPKLKRTSSLDEVLFSEGIHDTGPPSQMRRKNSLGFSEQENIGNKIDDFGKPKLKRTSSLDEVLFSEGIHDTGPPSQMRKKNSLGFSEQENIGNKLGEFEKSKLKRTSSLDEVFFSEGIYDRGLPSQMKRNASTELTNSVQSIDIHRGEKLKRRPSLDDTMLEGGVYDSTPCPRGRKNSLGAEEDVPERRASLDETLLLQSMHASAPALSGQRVSMKYVSQLLRNKFARENIDCDDVASDAQKSSFEDFEELLQLVEATQDSRNYDGKIKIAAS